MHRLSLKLAFAALAIGLLAAPAAQACQLICVVTNQTYPGDLKNTAPAGATGLAGADAKCAAEFPGFKFARTYSLLANIPSAAGAVTENRIYGLDAGIPKSVAVAELAGFFNPITPVGVAAAPTSGGSTMLSNAWVNGNTNCAAWTDANAGLSGRTTTAVNSVDSCNTMHPLLCCNM